jgi:hypothetical protein
MSVAPSAVLSEPSIHIESGNFPALVELIPGSLAASVYLHDVKQHEGSARCWSFVTMGLAAHGQREVVFMVKIPAGANPAEVTTEPLRFAVMLMQLASQGKLVKHGGFSELRGAGYLGAPGILYVNAPTITGVELPTGALLAIRVTEAELQVLRDQGATRVLSALGKTFRHYPYPPFSDASRGDIASPAMYKGSILEGVPHLQVHGWSRLANDKVTLEITEDAAATFAQALVNLPATAGFALYTHIDPTCDGCLVWSTGQADPSAITPPDSAGQKLCGAFVLVVPQQQANAVRIHEDGFALLLTDATARAFREALESAKPLEFDGAADELAFSLRWAPTRYVSPVDGKVTEAPEGFRQYSPETPANDPPESLVKTKEILLLTSEDDLAQRVSVDALSTFATGIIEAANVQLATEAQTAGWEVLVDITLAPGASGSCKIMSRGRDLDAVVASSLHTKIAALVPPVVEGEVHFQIFFESVLEARVSGTH